MYEIRAHSNCMFPIHTWFFHIISIYVYGLTPARNNGMHAFPVPTRPHTSLRTLQALARFGWTVLLHHPYSPDLVSSDVQLFGPQKDTLHGRRFEANDSVIRAVRTWLCEQETGLCTITSCKSYVYWTVHRCDSWRIRDQLDVTIY